MQSFNHFLIENTITLEEDFLGDSKTLIFYHRTGLGGQSRTFKVNGVLTMDKVPDFVDQFTKEFKIGKGALYGPGVYGYYTQEAALTSPFIGTYGNIVIKCRVNVENIILCDFDVSKKIYGKNYKVLDQLKLKKIRIPSSIERKIKQIDEGLENIHKVAIKHNKKAFTSDFARTIVDTLPEGSFGGILYTGKADLNAIVVYNPKLITAVSYNTTLKNRNEFDSSQWINVTNKKQLLTSMYERLATVNTPKDFTKAGSGSTKQIIEKIYKIVWDADLKTDEDFSNLFAKRSNSIYFLLKKIYAEDPKYSFIVFVNSFISKFQSFSSAKIKKVLNEFYPKEFLEFLNDTSFWKGLDLSSKRRTELDMSFFHQACRYLSPEYYPKILIQLKYIPSSEEVLQLFKSPEFKLSQSDFLKIAKQNYNMDIAIAILNNPNIEISGLEKEYKKKNPTKFALMKCIYYYRAQGDDAKIMQTVFDNIGTVLDDLTDKKTKLVLYYNFYSIFKDILKKVASEINDSNKEELLNKITGYNFDLNGQTIKEPLNMNDTLLNHVEPDDVIKFLRSIKDKEVAKFAFPFVMYTISSTIKGETSVRGGRGKNVNTKYLFGMKSFLESSNDANVKYIKKMASELLEDIEKDEKLKEHFDSGMSHIKNEHEKYVSIQNKSKNSDMKQFDKKVVGPINLQLRVDNLNYKFKQFTFGNNNVPFYMALLIAITNYFIDTNQ